MILIIGQNVERQQNANKMLHELKNLSADYKRLFDRWEDFKTTIDKINEKAPQIDISMNKLKK